MPLTWWGPNWISRGLHSLILPLTSKGFLRRRLWLLPWRLLVSFEWLWKDEDLSRLLFYFFACSQLSWVFILWLADVKNKWENSSWGRKLIVQKRRAALNDFDRFKLMLAKIKVCFLSLKLVLSWKTEIPRIFLFVVCMLITILFVGWEVDQTFEG